MTACQTFFLTATVTELDLDMVMATDITITISTAMLTAMVMVVNMVPEMEVGWMYLSSMWRRSQ